MDRFDGYCCDSCDTLFASFNTFRQIPQVEVNEDAADPILACPLLVLVRLGSETEHGYPHSLHSDDARTSDAQLLSASGLEHHVSSQDFQQGGWVSDDVEVVQDLRDAVVCEHSQLVDLCPGREQRMRFGGRGRIEGGPQLCNKNLGAFPDEHCYEKVVRIC